MVDTSGCYLLRNIPAFMSWSPQASVQSLIYSHLPTTKPKTSRGKEDSRMREREREREGGRERDYVHCMTALPRYSRDPESIKGGIFNTGLQVCFTHFQVISSIQFHLFNLPSSFVWCHEQINHTHTPRPDRKDSLLYSLDSLFSQGNSKNTLTHTYPLTYAFFLSLSLTQTHTHTQSTPTMLAYKCKVYKCVMRNVMTF